MPGEYALYIGKLLGIVLLLGLVELLLVLLVGLLFQAPIFTNTLWLVALLALALLAVGCQNEKTGVAAADYEKHWDCPRPRSPRSRRRAPHSIRWPASTPHAIASRSSACHPSVAMIGPSASAESVTRPVTIIRLSEPSGAWRSRRPRCVTRPIS